MSPAKLQRYAAFTVAYSLVAVLLVLGVVPTGIAIACVVVFGLPLLWSWGAYQAHLELNDELEDGERQLWRVGFYLMPPTMAAYWWLHVRRQAAVD